MARREAGRGDGGSGRQVCPSGRNTHCSARPSAFRRDGRGHQPACPAASRSRDGWRAGGGTAKWSVKLIPLACCGPAVRRRWPGRCGPCHGLHLASRELTVAGPSGLNSGSDDRFHQLRSRPVLSSGIGTMHTRPLRCRWHARLQLGTRGLTSREHPASRRRSWGRMGPGPVSFRSPGALRSPMLTPRCKSDVWIRTRL